MEHIRPTLDPGHVWNSLSRSEPPRRPAAVRLEDFLEIDAPFDEATAQAQASRCVQCAEPTCVGGCPLQLYIPEWLSLTADGRFDEAAALLQSTGTLPELCARLCPAERLCEGMCLISGRAEPVAIRAVEQFLNTYAAGRGLITPTVAPPNGWRVAVLGAGIGGLACAHELTRRGFAVTVFDHDEVPGARLAWGTARFRLSNSVLLSRIALLQKQGVVFRLGAPGGEVTRLELESTFDCTYLAVEAREPRTLDIPGADLRGVAPAFAFISQHRSGAAMVPGSAFDVRDKHVLVVGGGDTAIDCLRAALRCGAQDVLGVYRGDEQSLACCRHDYEAALEEGAGFLFHALPTAVIGNARGEAVAMHFVRTTSTSAGEEQGVHPVQSTRFELETDRIFLAIGSDPDAAQAVKLFPELFATGAAGLNVDANQMTRHASVFAGGDLVRGPCPALQAVQDARAAATGIHQYLLRR
jgi:glutamate synthase (NADPH) small chain